MCNPRGLHQECKMYQDAFLDSFIPYHLAVLARLCTHWTHSFSELMYIGIL